MQQLISKRPKNMKILVTGSSGHLGEAIMRMLAPGPHEAIGVDLNPAAYTHRVGSIADADFVRSCMPGVDVVLHTATLHKPHVATHGKQQFIETNITGTLYLLEQAKAQGVQSFIYTSTTSTFGHALRPRPHEAARWVTEQTVPQPKNIYGVTKSAAEDLCQLFYQNHHLPCLVLKTSRFFPEQDDDRTKREAYEDANLKANEYLHRRVDVEDAARAHLLAMARAPEIGFGKYIISATTPFKREHLAALNANAPKVVAQLFPDFEGLYAARGWRMFARIGRVYVNEKARTELGWAPSYDFRHVLDCLKRGLDFRSPLAQAIGSKPYHDQPFEDGPYPVDGT